MDVNDKIFGWAADYLAKDKANIAALSNESLREVLDSMAMVDLLVFLEQEFNITIDDDELTPENFASLNAAASLVIARLS